MTFMTSKNPSKILNFLLFQLGWWGNLLGAVYGLVPYSCLLTLLILVLHFLYNPIYDKGKEALFIFIGALVGFGYDSFLYRLGTLSFDQYEATLAPPWLFSIWLLFMMTVGRSFGWLKGRLILSALLGAIFGPLSYIAGRAFHIIDFPLGNISYAIMGLSWFFIMPIAVESYFRLTHQWSKKSDENQ